MRPLLRALFLLLLVAGTARAETRRIAVLVGNNAGAEREPLRYAEADASKLGQTLVELGGVRSDDVFLLQGRTPSLLREVLNTVRQRISGWRSDPSLRVVLLFYFSGHSDGEAFELGRERLPFAELRAWLSATPADVRVVLVDSCKSGALLAHKGGRSVPAFQIRLTDDLLASGEALLTSSAADELALESSELRGSFFTHHLISGLRGAADSSGDGVVTLGEAYQYAFHHTVAATAATVIGPQHPSYDFRLSGQGDLVLSTLQRPSGLLELPEGLGRVLIVQLRTDQVLAEIPPGANLRLAVPPGEFNVRAVRDGRILQARVTVDKGATRRVLASELVAASSSPTRAKGDASALVVRTLQPRPSLARFVVSVGSGVQGGLLSDVSALAALRLGLRSARASGWAVHADIASGPGRGYAETSALVYGGWRFGREGRRLGGFLGLEVGGGLVSQDSPGQASSRSAVIVAAPWVGGSVRLSSRVVLGLEAHVPLGWIRRDGRDALALLPAGWLAFHIQP